MLFRSNDTATTEIYTLSLHDALPISIAAGSSGIPGAVYNLGGGTRASMNDVLEIITELTGEELNVRRVAAQAGDARDTAADTSGARGQLGFIPSRSLYTGLSEQIAWQLPHRRRLRARLTGHGQPPRREKAGV